MLARRYPGFWIQPQVPFPTPPYTCGVLRKLDACAYPSPYYFFRFPLHPFACMESKSGWSRSLTQERQDEYIEIRYGFPIYYIYLPGVTGKFRAW